MHNFDRILIIWFIGFVLITAVIAIHYLFAYANNSTATTITMLLLVDPRDPDAIISCDDEICKAGLIIAAMDETLKINNSTSLLVFPPKP